MPAPGVTWSTAKNNKNSPRWFAQSSGGSPFLERKGAKEL
jgi:hypothetical protein